MTVYRIKSKSRSWDGEAIGILILDAAYPCIPGNAGNATTFDFPVRYKEVKGSSIDLLLKERDLQFRDVVTKAIFAEMDRTGAKDRKKGSKILERRRNFCKSKRT